MTYVFWQVDDDNINVINTENVRRIVVGRGFKGPVIVFFFNAYHATEYELPEKFSKRDVEILLNRLSSDPIVDLDYLVEGILRRRKKDEGKEVMKND